MTNRDSENDKTTPFIRDDKTPAAAGAVQPPYAAAPAAAMTRPIDGAMFDHFKAAKRY